MNLSSGLRKSSAVLKAMGKAHQANEAKGLVCTSSLWLAPSRSISGKVNRDRSHPLPAPYPYLEKQFKFWRSFLDKCSHRLDENSKLIVVEGAHGIGKSAFGAELAEELEMLYLPEMTHDQYYTSMYGTDLRDYKEYIPDSLQPFDDKDFVRQPSGYLPGQSDRYHLSMFCLKQHQYMRALRHILNTGQGVVIEKSIYSDYVLWDAALAQQWIQPESMRFYKQGLESSMYWFLRPNLIIYLDAPVDVVQKKIAANGKECDKNSPLFANKDYLTDVYNAMKRDYLRKAQSHSEVLVYDWTEPGDIDVVVEDIEKLNFDQLGMYDSAQKDWRFGDEVTATDLRVRFTTLRWHNYLAGLPKKVTTDAEHFLHDGEDVDTLSNLTYWLKGERYQEGFNTAFGDKNVLFKMNNWKEVQQMGGLPVFQRWANRPWYQEDIYLNK